MNRPLLLIVAATSCLAVVLQAPAATPSLAEIERLSRQGETLPIEVAGEYPLAEQRVPNDTGINVLVDLANCYLDPLDGPPWLRSHVVLGWLGSIGSRQRYRRLVERPGSPDLISSGLIRR